MYRQNKRHPCRKSENRTKHSRDSNRFSTSRHLFCPSLRKQREEKVVFNVMDAVHFLLQQNDIVCSAGSLTNCPNGLGKRELQTCYAVNGSV